MDLVNYTARKFGITRLGTTAKEAKRMCPATYAEDDPEPRYYPSPDRATHKVCLDPYREASKKILAIFGKYASKIQKVGLDEAFIDVTSYVNERLVETYLSQSELLAKVDDTVCDVPIDWDSLAITIRSKEEEGEEGQDSAGTNWARTTWSDLQLAIGAELAGRIRKQVFDELNYSCSAGIAHCKVAAKLCSSMNKPNKQTILRNVALVEFMKEIPFTKIRNLGGKLGHEVKNELNIEKAGDLWKYDMKDLQLKFGQSTGSWLYNIARGIDNEEVIIAKEPKSLMAAKSMNPSISTEREMQRWFTILGSELYNRILAHFEEYGSWPKTISMHVRSRQNTATLSKACPMLRRSELKSADRLSQKFRELFNMIEDPYPCIGLSFQALGLSQDESATSHTISKFFGKGRLSDGNETFASTSHKPNAPTNCITSFFAKEAKREEEGPSTRWTCDKCLQSIPYADIPEHTDYHFAMELQEQERVMSSNNDNNTHSTTSTGDHPEPVRNEKRKQEDDPNGSTKKRKRQSFFQSRS
ncbi:DNA-directed DNA polymerase eta rad30 [Apophysomyces ossiformis]|uniref:DNA polymerase eta n=1 Tax=Apophysomyces ossiformis TaxID=679940 RepID=A0A8H7BXD3_9FUNG|nr:DNA-directed DNA polymerase eta rad30 [Apophysomyces ossiformis]